MDDRTQTIRRFNIQYLCEQNGITVEHLSQAIGVCGSYFHRKNFQHIEEVADYFGITVEELSTDGMIPRYNNYWFKKEAALRGETLISLSRKWGMSPNYISRELDKPELGETIRNRMDKWINEVKI